MENKNLVIIKAMGLPGSGRTTIIDICKIALNESGYDAYSCSDTHMLRVYRKGMVIINE